MKYSSSFVTLILLSMLALPASATSYTVTTTDDELDASPSCITGLSTDCSLREAIGEANSAGSGSHTIAIPAGTYILTIVDASGDEELNATGDLDIDSLGTVTLTGAGIDSTIIDGNTTVIPDSSAIEVSYSNDVTIESLTIQNVNNSTAGGAVRTGSNSDISIDTVKFLNNASTSGAAIYSIGISMNIVDSIFDGNSTISSGNDGGAINVEGRLTLDSSLFIGNSAHDEGGAIVIGNTDLTTHTITNSTFYNNASMEGGAITVFASSGATVSDTVTIEHSTFSGNTASSDGAALHIRDSGDDTATINVYHSILDDNTEGASVHTNCSEVEAINGSISSGDYNIDSGTACGFVQTNDQSSTDAGLAALADNGGTTQTMAFTNYSTSPARDHIPAAPNCSAITSVDQRGLTRPENADCDIGAYEADQTDPVVAVTAGTDTIECSIDTWTDAGATATDNFDTTVSIASTTDTVDESVTGGTTITYTSEADYDGNTDTGDRTVTVSDTTAPVITVTGESATTLTVGDTYTEEGASLIEACDSTLLGPEVGGDVVDTATAGTYTVTYNGMDASGNSAVEAIRTITVQGDNTPKEVGEVSKTEGTLFIEYADATTDEIEPYNGKKGFKYTISANNERVVTYDGRRVKVYVNGELTDKEKLRKNKPSKSTHYKFKVKDVYTAKTYETVATMSVVKKNAHVSALRLTEDNQLKKVVIKKYTIEKKNKLTLTVKPDTNKVIATFGTGALKDKRVWKLNKKGKLKLQ